MRNKDGTFDKRSKAGKELEAARKEMEAEMEAKYAPKENYSDSAKNISQEKRTCVFFVSNHKLIVFLDCLEKTMGDRSISICKELTKVNEFVFRGNPGSVKNKILEDKENIKGEFVAVIDRQTSKNQDFDNIDLYSKELKKMATKFSLTDIVEIVHKFTKINKNKIYKWLLKLKK